jgi:cytochrome P450
MNQFPLLDRVIKESMRVLPPVVYAPRIAMQPAELGPSRVSRGTLVVTSHYVTHHLADIYPEPDRFLPDRWLNAAPSPYAYLPFGAGPRMCIGAPFVLQMLKVAVPLLIQRFRLAVVPGVRIDRKSDITLSPRGGIPVAIRRQDHRFGTSPVQGNIHDILHLPLSGAPATAA